MNNVMCNSLWGQGSEFRVQDRLLNPEPRTLLNAMVDEKELHMALNTEL